MINLSVKSKLYKNSGNAEVLRCVPKHAKCILDIGCGAGDNAKILTDHGVNVDGITLSNDEADMARAHLRTTYIHNLEEGLPPNLASSFDVILASRVLEHICFPEPLFRDVAMKLGNNGIFIVALPNLLNWRYRIKMFYGILEYECGDPPKTRPLVMLVCGP